MLLCIQALWHQQPEESQRMAWSSSFRQAAWPTLDMACGYIQCSQLHAPFLMRQWEALHFCMHPISFCIRAGQLLGTLASCARTCLPASAGSRYKGTQSSSTVSAARLKGYANYLADLDDSHWRSARLGRPAIGQTLLWLSGLCQLQTCCHTGYKGVSAAC